MSGRIALMVRGLPSIPIDEAVERFGKYYPSSRTEVFHKSPSFLGKVTGNSVSFTNASTGTYEGGQGINKQTMGDLRKLQEDFNKYITENPGIYTNSPTSASRARLYKRVGFNSNSLTGTQALDARRIADEDLPYVKALDSAIHQGATKNALNINATPAFLKSGDKVSSMSRINTDLILSALRGGNVNNILTEAVDYALSSKPTFKLRSQIKRRSARPPLPPMPENLLSFVTSIDSDPFYSDPF